jgi:hypothetical protein
MLMNVSGQIDVSDFENVEMLIKSLGISEETDSGRVAVRYLMIFCSVWGSAMIDRCKLMRQYATDQIKYIYYHLGWLYLDLMSRETEYIDEFARDYLDLGVQLLPPIPVLTDIGILK